MPCLSLPVQHAFLCMYVNDICIFCILRKKNHFLLEKFFSSEECTPNKRRNIRHSAQLWLSISYRTRIFQNKQSKWIQDFLTSQIVIHILIVQSNERNPDQRRKIFTAFDKRKNEGGERRKKRKRENFHLILSTAQIEVHSMFILLLFCFWNFANCKTVYRISFRLKLWMEKEIFLSLEQQCDIKLKILILWAFLFCFLFF